MDKLFCKHCNGTNLKKNGLVFGNQRYKCKDCGYQFTKLTPHGKDLTDKGTALSLCNLGISQNQTSKILGITPTSIARWIKSIPENLPFQFQFKSNNHEVDETTLRSYIKNLYIENKSNFILSQNKFNSGYEVDIIVKNKNIPEQTIKNGLLVCAFGDSILEGVIHDAQQDKYKILKNNFTTISGKILNVTWKNFARHGSTISNGIQTFLGHQNQIKNCDYLFFSFGGNDCNFDWNKISENPDNPIHQPHLTLENFHKKYVELISLAQSKGKIPILFTLPPIDPLRFFNNITKGRNEQNILKFLKNNINNTFSWHTMYNLEIFKIAIETNVPIIDITTYFISTFDYNKYLCDDGVHPNELGHQLMASALQDFYKQYFPTIE